MSAIFAASYPLPPESRSAFLEHCARELAALPMLGDGSIHRVVMQVQRAFWDPPTETGYARAGKYGHAR